MSDDLKPVIVTAPSTAGTGGSGPVIPTGTPIVLHIVHPAVVVLVRAGRTFFDSMLGFVTAGAIVPSLLSVTSFVDLLTTSALLSIPPTGLSVMRNLAELFKKLDQKYPTLTV